MEELENIEKKDYQGLIEKGLEKESFIKPKDQKYNLFQDQKKEFKDLDIKLSEISKLLEKQKGLAYKFGLKKTNPVLQEEFEKLSIQYKKVKAFFEEKGISTKDILMEKEEGGSFEKAEKFIEKSKKENNEKVEKLSSEKKKLFERMKGLAKDRRVQLIIGTGLVGAAIFCPPVSVLTGGLIQGFLPYSLAPLAKGLTAAAGGFAMRGFLKNKDQIKNEIRKEIEEEEKKKKQIEVPVPPSPSQDIPLEETVPSPKQEVLEEQKEEDVDVKEHYFGIHGEMNEMQKRYSEEKEKELNKIEMEEEMFSGHNVLSEEQAARERVRLEQKELNEKEMKEESFTRFNNPNLPE